MCFMVELGDVTEFSWHKGVVGVFMAQEVLEVWEVCFGGLYPFLTR